MTPEQFTYWLQGFAELNQNPPSEKQWTSIKQHLDLVFNKVTPKIENELKPSKATDPFKRSLKDLLNAKRKPIDHTGDLLVC